jgi:hypothetical protein
MRLFFYTRDLLDDDQLVSPIVLRKVFNVTYLVFILSHTVIPFVSVGAKFAICTVVGLNGTLVETKIYAHSSVLSAYFNFSKCPI